ncbi:MAG TPA: malto-oligosyltrehalose trehalohydrolase [Bryobacteraceae bacterium]|nr:malto-oligosyltrehalose trehalohydrolase [Bryobacteraceae bacterium]
MQTEKFERRRTARQLPAGAEVVPGGVEFRVWAPGKTRVEVVIEGGRDPAVHQLEPEQSGYFRGIVQGASAGTLYRYRLDGEGPYPDPASRFQPDGPHNPSEVIDPSTFEWTDSNWAGVSLEGQVLYEMHIGAFTPEGTWEAARRQLGELAALGITVLEIMPVSEFPGRFGWGYDGVHLFAPTRLYGRPDGFRQFVNDAHAAGMGVILDVVYNHLGPDGNYLGRFSEHYFTDRYTTDWGEAINFDGKNCAEVREFFLSNAACWIREYHLDGLRLDATQDIYDSSQGEHILAEMARRTREAAKGRTIILIGENEPQETRLIRPPEQGGYGLDALWNDDLHHTAMVTLTGRNDAYYSDYRGSPQEYISAFKYGYLYQGQRYKWQEQRRGTPTAGLKHSAFVNFIQNHDQIANSARGQRCHALTSPGQYKAVTAVILLAPGTPMLFMGQEFAASTPFLYFADHTPELSKLVREGRAEFLAQWRSLGLDEMQSVFADPAAEDTFKRCKLNSEERRTHAEIYALHRDLLKLRREDPVFRRQGEKGVDGAVLGPEAFLIRFFGKAGDDRLLVVNLGLDLHLSPAPEPLLAPPEDRTWSILWSSEHPAYGGTGTAPLETEENWKIPGHAAVVLGPAESEPWVRGLGSFTKKRGFPSLRALAIREGKAGNE